MVFRLGRYNSVRGPGLYWIIPIIEWQRMLDLRTKTVSVEQQETITQGQRHDQGQRRAVVSHRRSDEGRSSPCRTTTPAVYQVALTTLRNIIGQHCWTRC